MHVRRALHRVDQPFARGLHRVQGYVERRNTATRPRRRRRPLPGPAPSCRGVLHRREDRHSGARPPGPRVASLAGPGRAARHAVALRGVERAGPARFRARRRLRHTSQDFVGFLGLDRRDRVSPLSPGRVERHGTLSLYAALNVRDRRGSGQDDGSGTRARTSWGFSGKWSRPGNPMKSST